MSSLMRSRRSRVARRTASITTSGRSDAMIVTRPEKFLSRSVPPGCMGSVRLTCSVSSNTPGVARAGVASASTAKAAARVRMDRWTGKGRRRFRAEGSGLKVQRARVDRHADDGVDAERVEVVDFLAGSNAAGCGHAARGRSSYGGNRFEAGAAHQAFGVDVG